MQESASHAHGEGIACLHAARREPFAAAVADAALMALTEFAADIQP